MWNCVRGLPLHHPQIRSRRKTLNRRFRGAAEEVGEMFCYARRNQCTAWTFPLVLLWIQANASRQHFSNVWLFQNSVSIIGGRTTAHLPQNPSAMSYFGAHKCTQGMDSLLPCMNSWRNLECVPLWPHVAEQSLRIGCLIFSSATPC